MDSGQLFTERLLGNSRVMCGLPAQPPTVAQTKVATKPKVRVGCDGARTRNDLADPLCWHADVLSEAVPCKTQWLEKLFFKHLADCTNGPTKAGTDTIVDLLRIYDRAQVLNG